MKDYQRNLSRLCLAVFVFLLSVSCANAQSDEPVSANPAVLLSAVGRTENLSGAKAYKLFPLENGSYTETLSFPGTASFRVHFSRYDSAPATVSWNVRLVSLATNEELWSFSGEASARDFWSSEINGSVAKVVVTAGSGDNNLQLVVDKVTQLRARTIPQGEVNFHLQPIRSVSPAIQRAGRSIAYLLIQPDGDDLPYGCTAFVVGRDLLMTNRHCIQSGSEARNADVQFDYDTDGSIPVRGFIVKELVLASCDLDFVILRLNRSLACVSVACNTRFERPPLQLARNASLTPNQPLVAIQHPDNEAKQVSLLGCLVDQLQTPGAASTLTDFSHKCDTKKGSSGTPLQVISAGNSVGAVVGLHHLSFRTDRVDEQQPKLVNRAVSIKQIIEFISQTKPALLGELSLQ